MYHFQTFFGLVKQDFTSRAMVPECNSLSIKKSKYQSNHSSLYGEISASNGEIAVNSPLNVMNSSHTKPCGSSGPQKLVKTCQFDKFGSSIWHILICRGFSCHLTSSCQFFYFSSQPKWRLSLVKSLLIRQLFNNFFSPKFLCAGLKYHEPALWQKMLTHQGEFPLTGLQRQLLIEWLRITKHVLTLLIQ